MYFVVVYVSLVYYLYRMIEASVNQDPSGGEKKMVGLDRGLLAAWVGWIGGILIRTPFIYRTGRWPWPCS
jgi:hypothetical protein